MTRPFTEFSGQFFWDFKRMDNVNYNFAIIELLYKAKKINGNDTRFNKPIIILIMAIIECVLYDFLIRINQHRIDSLPNITETLVSFFRNSKETDELKIIIPQIKSQNLLKVNSSDTIYSDLEHLRKVRNRLHIQNKYAVLDRDEFMVFTDFELIRAQDCLEKIFSVLCNDHPRWGKPPIPMSEFPRPWI